MKILMPKQPKISNSIFIGNTKRAGEGQLYDKIMRENLQELFLPLIEEELKFKVKNIQPLPDKQPTTIIRETDAFLLVETYSEAEPKFILHLEFESKDDDEMVYRMSEYHGIELRKYRLPIKHVVVYLGEKAPKMRTKLELSEVFDGFTLVNAKNFSPEKWLTQEEPSKVIMAILGDYQKQNAKIILDAIFKKLRRVCKTQLELKKYIKQLIIISRMRNLEQLTIKISEAMPITIDIEKDYLYNLGLNKGNELIQKAKEATAKAKKKVEELAKEKAELEANVKLEAARLEAAKLEASAKLEVERLKNARLEAEKIRTEKKVSILKMQAKEILSDEEIMDFLNLNEETFKEYISEIQAEKNQENL
jgi:hypothetical protein